MTKPPMGPPDRGKTSRPSIALPAVERNAAPNETPAAAANATRMEPGAGGLATVMFLVTNLRQLFSSPNYRPPLLPTVALEVHELTFVPDVDVDRVVSVLEKDAMLAAQILRVAGSAAYGGWGGEVSLKQAVIRLGLKNLNSVTWEVAANLRVFRSQNYGPLMEQLRTHSTVSAHLCRFVATQRQLPPELAFLCGLLHDIGMAATLLVLADQVEGGRNVDPILLDLVLGETHQEISGLIARLWHLPTEVEFVLANHHNGADPEKVTPLSAVVTVAESLGQELGYGMVIGGGRCDYMDPKAVDFAYESLAFDKNERSELLNMVSGLASMMAGESSSTPKKPATARAAAPSTAASSVSRAAQAAVAIKKAAPASSARKKPLSLWSRILRAFGL